MTCIGTVQDGKVLLPPEVKIPSGTRVKIESLSAAEQAGSAPDTLDQFIGIFNDLPTDLARNHDHYLHGHLKR